MKKIERIQIEPVIIKGKEAEGCIVHEADLDAQEAYIKQLEENKKWISVEDRLPEESGRYWCYVAEQNSLGLSFYQWNCAFNFENKRWSSNSLYKCVTHWMPLPQPPQEKE